MTNVCDVALDVSVAAPTSTAFAVSGPVGVPMKILPGQSAQFMLSVDALALGARSGELVMQVAAGDVRWASTASLIAQNDPRLDSTNIYNLPRAIRENWLIAVAGGPSIQPALAHLEATLARAPGWPLTDVAFAVVSAAPDGGDFLSTDAGTRIVTTSSATWRNDLAALVQLPTASTRSSCIDALLRAVDFGRMTGLNPSTPWSDDGLLRSGARTRVVCITAQRDDTELDADAAFLALQMGLLRTSYNLYTYGPGGSCPQQEFAPGIVEDLVQRTRGAVLRTCESLGHLALPDAFRILTLQVSPEDASWLIVDIDGRATPSVGANGAQVWQYDPQRKVVAFEEFHAGKTITIRVLQPCP